MNGTSSMRYPLISALPLLALATGCLPLPAASGPVGPPICHAKREQPWTAPDFIAAGNEARDRALAAENSMILSPPVGAAMFGTVWTEDLRDARDCYERAAQANPGSYDARLGLGTVYLVAGLRSNQTTANNTGPNPFFPHAKRELGRAYFLRAERNEPIFYLTVIATAENQLPTAQYLLGQLQKNQPNDGEVLFRIEPSQPSRSVMFLRATTRDDALQVQMPPIATHIVDDAGVAIFEKWINALPPP